MTNHKYMYPRVTELTGRPPRELRAAAPVVSTERGSASRMSQRDLVEWSLVATRAGR